MRKLIDALGKLNLSLRSKKSVYNTSTYNYYNINNNNGSKVLVGQSINTEKPRLKKSIKKAIKS